MIDLPCIYPLRLCVGNEGVNNQDSDQADPYCDDMGGNAFFHGFVFERGTVCFRIPSDSV